MNKQKFRSNKLSILGALMLQLVACGDLRERSDEELAYPASPQSPPSSPGGESQAPRVRTPAVSPLAAAIYVHGPYVLYKFVPAAAELSKIGEFDCLLADMSGTADSGMHDIAVSSDGSLYGVAKVGGSSPGVYTSQVIVSIDKETGRCKKEMAIDPMLLDPSGGLELRGLSFVPPGTVSASEEALVALEIYGSYVRIDLKSKRAERLGSLNGAAQGPWKTKGADIVSIVGEKTYSTAQGPLDDERLVVLDPTDGRVQSDIGSLGGTIFGGLAYWGGTLYGFTVAGRVFAIDPRTARTTEVLIKAPADTRFDGAGVTTLAPILPPG